jgi:hypothetical protein
LQHNLHSITKIKPVKLSKEGKLSPAADYECRKHSSAGCFDNIVSVAGAVDFVIKIVVLFLSVPVF